MKMLNLDKETLAKIGGLSPDERRLRGIEGMVAMAVESTQHFQEALRSGRGIKHWLHTAMEAASRLREAHSETALGFLLRKGIQSEAQNWYTLADRAWQKYCLVTGSNNVAEFYAPLYPSTIAGRVGRGERYPEGRIIGEDNVVVNQKFGQIIAVERELFDDDQTGQIRDRASLLGQSMGVTESVWASSRFIGAARTYMNLEVPASAYTTIDTNGNTISTPFSTSLFGSTGNRPSSYGILNMPHMKQGYVAATNAVDPLGNRIVVSVDTLLHSTQDVINAQILLAPGGYPAVLGSDSSVLGGTTTAAGATQGALAGFAGGWGSPNPWAGMGIKSVLERYFPDNAWALGQAHRGIIFQERDPLEVIQEAPSSGSYFQFDVIQWRARRRFECEWIGGGSRFWYLGNNGDAATLQ